MDTIGTAYDLAAGIGYLTIREVDAIKAIARRLRRSPICVNIGSGAGTSIIALMEERADALMTDIDIDPKNGLAQINESGFIDAEHYYRMTGDSKYVVWPDEVKIDCLFIDGDHSEAGIRGDLMAWLPRMAAGGYVLIHDYWPYPGDHKLAGVDYWPDVRRVVDQIIDLPVDMDMDRLRIFQVP